MILRFLFMLAVTCFLSVALYAATLEQTTDWTDQKCCENPRYDWRGKIIRSSTAVRHFKLTHICPSTLVMADAPCPDYDIDHVHPLARCGRDHPTNMQYLKKTIKSCAGTECKDRWELKAYKCPVRLPIGGIQ